jgi:hypothetical protein
MLLTETEAKTKWCPLVRAANVAEPSANAQSRNRDGSGGPSRSSLCIASGCMFWRFEEHSDKRIDPRGYCGAAGKPE